YVSLTQLLVRSELFQRVGLFESRWGSISDFNWNMRATLIANTVHVPNTWASWRWHPQQATAQVDNNSDQHLRRKQEMIDHALAAAAPVLGPPWIERLKESLAAYLKSRREFELSWKERSGQLQKLGFLLRALAHGSPAARDYLRHQLIGSGRWTKDIATLVEEWLEQVPQRSSDSSRNRFVRPAINAS